MSNIVNPSFLKRPDTTTRRNSSMARNRDSGVKGILLEDYFKLYTSGP
jgi:hypothetical protein